MKPTTRSHLSARINHIWGGWPVAILLCVSILLAPAASFASQSPASTASLEELLSQLRELLATAQPTSEAVATPKPIATLKPTPRPTATPSPYIGVVKIDRTTNKAYTEARVSPDANADIIYRVHYGERYLCTGKTGDWYEIELYTAETGYVPAAYAFIDSYETDEITLSDSNFPWDGGFTVKLKAKADAYSQPKSGAQAKRYSGDGSTYTTFFFSKGAELTCAAKTKRGGETWYMLLSDANGVQELFWIKASACTVTSGDPNYAVIPGSWYD